MRSTRGTSRRWGVRREGSPWTGLWAVVMKELADHLSSVRMQLLEGLIFLTALGSTYGEHNRHTLSRVLSQPIYRDALLLGKFLAGMFTLGVSLLALWLLVTGMGLLVLGVVPGIEEVARGLLFLLTAWAYAGIWLALAIALSVIFRQTATSALAAIAVWLFFAIFWDMVVQVISAAAVPTYSGSPSETLAQLRLSLFLSRLSPNTLFAEIVLALLNPAVRSLGPIFITQLEGAVLGTPLPVGQSLLLAWPQFTGLVAGLLLLFAGSYVLFQRQEVRA